MTPEELMSAYLDDFRRKYAGKRVQKTPTSLFAFALSNWSGRTQEDVARETAWLLDSFATYCGRNGVVGTWHLAARWICSFHANRIRRRAND